MEVLIRPIRSDDSDRLRAAFGRLTPESKYRRFLVVKPRLTAADAHYLSDVDGADHVALVATTAGTPVEIVAVARFVRLREDPRAAEFSIVVGDAYQGAGLGSELLRRLAEEAVGHGIDRFTATILSENTAIYGMIKRLAAGPIRRDYDGYVLELEFDLAAARLPLAA